MSPYLRRGKYKESGPKERLVVLSGRNDNDHVASAKGVALVPKERSLCRSSILQELRSA